MKSCIFFILFCFALGCAEVASGEAGAGFLPIRAGRFKSPLLKRELPFRVFAPKEHNGKPLPAVVYVKNIERKSGALGLSSQIFFGTPIGHDFDYVYLRYIISFLDPYMK